MHTRVYVYACIFNYLGESPQGEVGPLPDRLFRKPEETKTTKTKKNKKNPPPPKKKKKKKKKKKTKKKKFNRFRDNM